MSGADDPAVVLEQFTQDASNLAPEITHLMEEIEAKDKVVRECEISIKQRDRFIQRQIKNSGIGSSSTPKEEADVKSVLAHYDTAVAHQDEKVALAEKACTLLARHTKRLDVLIRELASNGGLEIDDALASLLNGTSTTSLDGASRIGSSANGASSLNGHHGPNGNPAAGTAPPSSTLANSNLARLVTSNLAGTGSNAGGAGRARSPGGTPTSATQARGSREGSTDAKRRRLNLPASGLRQSSTGPGTPKAGTPQPSGGRAGSVPRGGANKKDSKASGSNKLLAPPRGGHVNPDSKAAKARKKKGGGAGASSRKRGGASGVSDADDSAVSNAGDESGSERLSANGGPAASNSGGAGAISRSKDGVSDRADRDRDSDEDDDDDVNHKHDDEDAHMADSHGVDGVEEEEEDDEGGDTNLYCTCRSVSYGNMVACDSDDCPYEWFHWNCVGLTKEPPGKWYCVECKARLGMK